MNIKKNNFFVTIIFFLTYFLVGIKTFKDFGVNIEEHTQVYSGFYWLNYIYNFFQLDLFQENLSIILSDISKDNDLPKPNKYTYGPVFDLPIAFIELFLRSIEIEFYYFYRHLSIFIIFFISSVFVFKILSLRFKNLFLSLFGTFLYIFSPRVYGDSFHNNKDILFLSLVVFSIYYLFKVFKEDKFTNIILFSLFSALSTSTRIIGIFLPFSIIIFLLIGANDKKKEFKNTIFIFIFYCLFLYFHWPYLWENPLKNFFNYIVNSKDWIFSYYILFQNNYFLTTNLPDSYIFVWIAISTPILNLVIFLSGFYILTSRQFKRFILVDKNPRLNFSDFWRSKNEMLDCFILTTLISIFLILIFLKVSYVSGWRHLYFLNFYFIYIGINFLNFLFLKYRNYKLLFSIIALILLTPNIYKIIIFHPYQSLYFNEFLSDDSKNNFLIDREGLSRLDSIKKILFLEKEKKTINIANSSFIPLYRIKSALSEEEKSRLNFVGTNYFDADYIYNINVYEINPRFNDKYNIPNNFSLIYELKIDGVIIYELYKKR